MKKRLGEIFWIVVFIGVAISLVLGVLVSNVLRADLQKETIIHLEENTTIIAEKINTYFVEGKVIIEQMATNETLRDYVIRTDSYEKKRSYYRWDEVITTLQNIKASNNELLNVWAGTNGMNDLLTDDPTYDTAEGFDFDMRPWYLKMVKEDGQVSFSDPYVDWIKGGIVVTVSTPVIENNVVKGALGVDLDIQDITDFVHSYYLGDSGKAILINESGQMIVEEETEKLNSLIGYERFDDVKDVIIHNESGVELIETDFGNYYLSFAHLKSTGWYVVYFLSEEEATKNQDLLNILNYSSYFSIIAIILLGLIIMRIRSNFTELNTVHSNLIVKEEEIRIMAEEDPLTGVPNRRKFLEVLEETLKGDVAGVVVMLDLDNFKEVNDVMGHVYGDDVLKLVAKELDSFASENVFVSRFGGDEFLILITVDIVPNKIRLIELVESQIEAIEHSVNKQYIKGDENLYIEGSLGVASFPYDSNKVTELIKYADLAMYKAKSFTTKKRSFFDAKLADVLVEKGYVEKVLRDAIDLDSLKLVYQPLVDSKTKEIVSFEALLRHKENVLTPDKMIPVAEENGLIVPIGRWVLKEAVMTLVRWKSKGIPLKPIAVNFSVRQLTDHKFVDYVISLLEKYDIESKYIEIEVTESIFLDNNASANLFFARLSECGIAFALDDFGTGYSSLSYLDHIPLKKLKIDKYLIDKYKAPYGEVPLVRSIIELSHNMGMKVVAEGVEEVEQYEWLRGLSCDMIQGYLFSKPVEYEETVELIKHIYIR